MTEQPNVTWWIVLSPSPMRELVGVLVKPDGERVHSLMGPMEEQLVRDLAAYADPTVDVSVAHGWAQAPAGLEEAYRAGQAEQRRREDANENGTALGRIVRRQR